MLRGRTVTLSSVVLLACLAVLPACKKSKPTKSDSGGGATQPTPGPVTPTPSSPSGYVLFAHLNAKDITDSPVLAEVKQAFAKSGGSAEWDKAEGDATKTLGVKPTDINSLTVCVTEVPARDVPKFVLILTANTPIDKMALLGPGQAKPDARGFFTNRGAPGLFHFPDDKTIAMVHPDLAQKYLDGYAKNRSGWPMTGDLTKAGAGHTLYVVAHLDKVPSQMLNQGEMKELVALQAARTLTLWANLKGKELSVSARASFPDAASAGKARDTVQKFLGKAINEVEKVMSGKGPSDFSAFGPAVKEAQRALKDAKVVVSGSDLSIAGSYKADFDIGAMVANAVPRIKEGATRTTAQNNLKQIGLALHNYASTYGSPVPVYAVGAKGLPLKTPNDKPLLSWRVALLPYLEQEQFYNQFKLDEPWDSPNNKKLIEKMPKIYAPVAKPGKPGYTHLQMAIGPKALQPSGTRIPASFPDGMSNTIAVAEAAEPVIWTKPDDVMLPGKEMPKDLKKKFGGQFPNGFNVLLWDGSVRFISNSISERTLGLALNPMDGQPLGSDW